AVGLLTTRARRALVTPWALAGAAIALGLWLPTVQWQATHGWPQLELSRHLRDPPLALFTAPHQVVLLAAASLVAFPGRRRPRGRGRGPGVARGRTRRAAAALGRARPVALRPAAPRPGASRRAVAAVLCRHRPHGTTPARSRPAPPARRPRR